MAIVKPPDMSIPAPSGKPGGLGDRLETALVRFAGRVLNSAKDTLAGILRFALDTFLEGIEPFLIRAYRPLLTQIKGADGCPPELQSLIDMSLSGEAQAGAALLQMVGSGLGGGLMGSIGGAVFGGWTRWANSKARQLRPDLMMAQAMYRRGSITEEQYKINLAELGWSEQAASAIWQITQPRPDINTLASDLYRRGQPLDAIKGELIRRGFPDADADKIINVLRPIPGPGDLISMAVREGWNDQIAARFGYDADLPSEFVEWMGKQGYTPDWCRRWWRAHWELPGPTMAREMLHRTSMTQSDYALLLKTADYPVQWRQWMIETAYEPYTRVDIRRMYQVGVLKTEAELMRAYKDIGYDDDKARHMVDFTVADYGDTERTATKDEILTAYGIGRLTEAEARGYLVEMRYPAWVIDTYISRVDLGRVNGLAKAQITHAQTMYVNGQLDKTGVYTALAKIPLSASEIERYLEEWEIARTAKIARPTRADLLRFFLQNEMTEQEFRTELAGYRLSPRYIDWYIADAKRKLVLQAQKETDDAKAEQLRVQASATKTAYDIQLADLSVQIAQLNLTIADLKASVTPEMTLEEANRIGTLVQQCALQIKQLQLDKATTHKAYLETKKG